MSEGILSGGASVLEPLSGNSPNLNYTFLRKFDMSLHYLENPFSALFGSPLSSPPTGITAMVSLGDGSVTLAFQQMELYMFTCCGGQWEYKGTAVTPCR